MYTNHFGLERRIFRGNATGADVFVGPRTATLLGGIKRALAAPDAVVTLTGAVGCGKSTAAAHSLGAISGKNAIVRVGRFPLQRGELLDLLFDHMRIQRRPQRGSQKLALFRQLLLNLARNDSRMFILVEDAPFIGPNILAELEAVTAPDSGPSDGAALVVMGDESLEELLATKTLTRLKQRTRLRRKLDPCSVEELGGYLRHCFRQAGGDFDKTFADGAAEHLHELSGGILRVANNLVDSSLEAAADADADIVSLELVSQTADQEFGLTGSFSQLPEISSKQPEPRHSDDATAELVAVSLPDPEPAASPAATVREPVKQDDDTPELIQDTQPALAILDDTPPARSTMPPPSPRDTLPDIEQLAAELSAGSATTDRFTPDAASEATAGAEPDAAQSALSGATPDSAPLQVPDEIKSIEDEPASAPAADPQEQTVPEANLELELETEAEQDPTADEAPPQQPDADNTAAPVPGETTSSEDVPDWERDPTLAELRPDLDALERAMAVAHGRDPDTPDDPAATPEPASADSPEDEIDDIPEITLDDSINRKVDKAVLESEQGAAIEGRAGEDENDDDQEDRKEEVTAGGRERDGKAVAELEEIAVGLSKAKTIEDVDDKMAETLFGEELNAAAAAVAARVAEEAAAAAATATQPDPTPASPASPAKPETTAMEREFEKVWGERPGVEVSIDSRIDEQHGGLDVSASQRLATVRALNSGRPGASPQMAPVDAVAVAQPDPIEEQITTSLTQTMKVLNVSPGPEAVNDDDDDDDERKGGFFSRFRRS
jgi:type II secretory pathway predicted ATPase ExeA